MDPISQAVVGACCATPCAPKRQWAWAALAALISAMAADLDVFLRSTHDPLMFLEYHRHFTHAIAFIPLGGLCCALLCYMTFGKRRQLSWWRTYLICTVAYGTHGLLDACTSYGTQLWWPFSDSRVSWDIISIIDPLFTVPLCIFLALTVTMRQRRFAILTLLYLTSYLALGSLQHHRALQAAHELAAQRGHQITRLSAKPSLGNLLLWKSIYATTTHFYVDAIRAGWKVQYIEGTHIARLNPARDLPWLQPDSRHARDLARFRTFSQGYIALDPHDPHLIIDVRYSMLPNSIDALWGIRMHPTQQHRHVDYAVFRENTPKLRRTFWRMLTGHATMSGT